jgi:hypothetical protein
LYIRQTEQRLPQHLDQIIPTEIEAIPFSAVERESRNGQRFPLRAGFFHPIIDTTRNVPAVADL